MLRVNKRKMKEGTKERKLKDIKEKKYCKLSREKRKEREYRMNEKVKQKQRKKLLDRKNVNRNCNQNPSNIWALHTCNIPIHEYVKCT